MDNYADVLSQQIRDLIAKSERDGGLFLKDLKSGDKVTVETRNSIYEIEVVNGEDLDVKIKGGMYIPEFINAKIAGSSWSGSLLKMGFIGNNMHLEVYSEELEHQSLITSAIHSIRLESDDLNYEVKPELLN